VEESLLDSASESGKRRICSLCVTKSEAVLMLLKCLITFFVFSTTLYAQTGDMTFQTISDYESWGWDAVVMQNGIITLATVPAIGGRVMEYNLGSYRSVFVNSAYLGETYTPAQNGQWYNFGGFKTWPAPQSSWPGTWPPPPSLDYGAYSVIDSMQTADSIRVTVLSPIEKWIAPGIRFLRIATMFPGTSRLKMQETIYNTGSDSVSWSIWGVTQSIVHHPNESDYQNFWVYFPINPNSVFGSSGVAPQGPSTAWKGEIANGVYGVEFVPDNQKIYADPDRGWIAYADLADSQVFAKTFGVFDGAVYPDGGARVSVYVSGTNPLYLEVEIKGPLVSLAPGGGSYEFTENWWAAKAEGPVLDVDSVGVTVSKLSYDKSSQILRGRYGVFYNGTARAVFLDAQGRAITEGPTHSVSPLKEFQLEENISIPDSAQSVEIQVHDSSGVLLGNLETENVAQLSLVVNRKALASGYRLIPNYPNPFNGGTVIAFFCPVLTKGSLRIYDVMGREVGLLASGEFTAGEHRYSWNPENLASGVYILDVATDRVHLTQKMVYLR